MLPGRTKSVVRGARTGKPTATKGALVSASLTDARSWRSRHRRGAIPIAARAKSPTTVKIIARALPSCLPRNVPPRMRMKCVTSLGRKCRASFVHHRIFAAERLRGEWRLAAQQTVNDRHKEQGREGGKSQA